MKTMLCIKCNMSFPSEKEFEAHKASGHTIPGTPIDAPDQQLPPGIPSNALPDAEFMQRIQELEQAQATPPTDPIEAEKHKKEMEERLKAITPEPKKVQLTYFYTGDCDVCLKPVTTLEVDVDGKHHVIAYCTQDNKQIIQREVANLNG